MDVTEIKNAVEELTASVSEKTKEMLAVKDKLDSELKDNGKHRADTTSRLDAIVKDVAASNAKILEMQQRQARPSHNERPQSVGESFVSNEAFKGYDKNSRRGLVVQIENTVTSASTSGGALIAPDRKDLVIAPPDMQLRVRNLCMPGSTDSNLVQYQREKSFTNTAAGISEGAAYTQSDVVYEPADAKVKKIGHIIKATKEALDDAPMLQSLIDGRLRYGVLYREDEQLLLGDGTGNNLLGIVPQATAYDTTRTQSSDNATDIISHAITQAISDEYFASGIVLNPNDWEKMRLLKTTDGVYIFAGPMQSVVPTLWGLPVVVTNAMPAGQFLTGAFSIGSQIFDRKLVEVEISTENDKDFESDLVSIKCSERLAFAVYRPAAFVTGAFA